MFASLRSLGDTRVRILCSCLYGFYNDESQIAYTTNCSLCADPTVVILTGKAATAAYIYITFYLTHHQKTNQSPSPSDQLMVQRNGLHCGIMYQPHVHKRKNTTYETGICD